MARVELRGVSKVYPGGIEAVSEVDLAVGDGELLVIVGPSGSGKSTMLRLIAGLEPLTAGSVWIDGQRADQQSAAARDVAMVFQSPALYPHLSVSRNLAFGLRARGRSRVETRERVQAVAAQLGLTDLLERRPRTLSGGQRQRVALGRAIARRPRVYLFDEPFSSLDTPLRASLRAELLDLHQTLGATMIHVTHDQAEALALGHRVAVMDRGRIVQIGPPLALYEHPANRFVAQFLGNPGMSILPCEVGNDDGSLWLRPVGCAWESGWSITRAAGWTETLLTRGPGRVDLGLRAEHVRLLGRASESTATTGLTARAEVRRVEPQGHETLGTLLLGSHPLSVRLPASARTRIGEQVSVQLDLARAAWFDAGTGAAIETAPGE